MFNAPSFSTEGSSPFAGKGTTAASEQHSKELESDWTTYNVYVSETSASTRLAFLRRVYGTLLVQLAFTAVITTLCAVVPFLRDFLVGNLVVQFVGFLGSLVLIFFLHAKKDEHPTNLYLLAAWTVCLSLMVSQAVIVVPVGIVLEAAALTVGLVLGLTAYVFITKKDFSYLGASLTCALWLLILIGFLRLLFPTFTDFVELLYLGGGAFLFCLFILYDTSSIMHRYSIDDWIPAVISLYLDIINLFLYILELLRRRD